jgi:hypothetical protein
MAASAEPALAQPDRPPPVQEQQRPERGTRETERAERAHEASEALRPLGPGERVTYQDVLQHPDDVDLNYRYAQTQVADGDLRGAASTLERILLVAPDLARVRLLYAVVLYRLDNLNESEREFRAVAELPMAATLREEVTFYLEQIALRRKTTRYTATLAGGAQWDSNRNAGPRHDRVLFLDTPLELVTGKKEDDFAGIGIAGLHVQHDLGYEAGHALLGAVQVYGQKQVDVTDLDLMALSAEGGGLYRSPIADVQPSIYGTYLNLGGESYVETVGAGVRANHHFSERLDLFARFRLDWENFENLDESPTTEERTGARVQGGIGASWAPWPRLRLDAGAGWLHKDADQEFYQYTGPAAYLGATYLLGRGQFLLSTFSYEYDRYDGPDPIVSPDTRRDSIYVGGLTYGVPLGVLLPFLGSSRALGDTLLTANATYVNENSNLENYTYDDWRVSILFNKSFEF